MSDVQVSDEIRSMVSPDLLAFVRDVLGSEGLSHWPVHVWPCKSEGVCDDTIRFGLCKTERRTKRLFLHEVAHAIINEKGWHEDSYWHKDAWQKEFKRLCKTYLELVVAR